jgi:YggT family protein
MVSQKPVKLVGLRESASRIRSFSKRNRERYSMNPFIWLLFTLIDLYFYVILAVVIISWLTAFNIINGSNPYVRQANYILRQLTEPLLAPIRRVLPNLGGLDFSPIVLLLGLQFLKRAIVYYLYGQ